MGGALFRADPLFRAHVREVDARFRALTGEGVLPAILDAEEPLLDVRRSHPAIFAVQYALSRTLAARGVEAGALLGMSTGEIAAAVAGGALSVADGVRCTAAQAEAIAYGCPPGGMLAIVRPPEFLDQLEEECSLALAARTYFVVAGAKEAIDRIDARLRDRHVPRRRLPTTTGFHSPLLDQARARYEELTAGVRGTSPTIATVSCAEGGQAGPVTPALLWAAIRQPMRVGAAVDALAGLGVTGYLDLGPGTALTTFVRDSGVGWKGRHALEAPLTSGGPALPRG